jgi:hypothetical protein
LDNLYTTIPKGEEKLIKKSVTSKDGGYEASLKIDEKDTHGLYNAKLRLKDQKFLETDYRMT